MYNYCDKEIILKSLITGDVNINMIMVIKEILVIYDLT